jgi:hypothetical protein
MAETLVVKSLSASIDASTGMLAPQISGKIAGEDILTAVTPCEIRSDGLVWKASGAAADSHARLAGVSTRPGVKAGEPITLYGLGTVAKYSDELLTPGAVLYLGTGGILSSTASVGDAVGIAQAIDASNIRITRAI